MWLVLFVISHKLHLKFDVIDQRFVYRTHSWIRFGTNLAVTVTAIVNKNILCHIRRRQSPKHYIK